MITLRNNEPYWRFESQVQPSVRDWLDICLEERMYFIK